MSHLTLETLARLVEEAPTEPEAAHLAACEPCRAELDALREDVRALATLPDMTPAPDAWDDLARRLADEGIVRTRHTVARRFRPLLQVAAAAVLFAGGLAVGRALGSAAQPHLAHAPAEQRSAASGSPVPRTMDEATALLRQTEELYLGALTRYAELATQADAGDPVARLAALQSIVMTTQAALTQTPTDPVINGYHLTALAQRDATLRQVAAATSDRWY